MSTASNRNSEAVCGRNLFKNLLSINGTCTKGKGENEFNIKRKWIA